MKIEKTNENYSLSETLENGWQMSGNASKSTDGGISINFWVNSDEGANYIGDMNYNEAVDADRINYSYNIKSDMKSEFVTYGDTIIENVLEHFAE